VKTTRTGTISGVPIGAAVSIPGPPQLPVTAYPRPAPPADDAARSYEKQLERLEKQIEELRHAVEELTPKN
jgi:hypothetical protein